MMRVTQLATSTNWTPAFAGVVILAENWWQGHVCQRTVSPSPCSPAKAGAPSGLPPSRENKGDKQPWLAPLSPPQAKLRLPSPRTTA